MGYRSIFSFQSFECEGDFSLVGVVEVFIADLFGDHSALDLGVLLFDQVEPNSHQRVDIGRLTKRRQSRGWCYFICVFLKNNLIFWEILFCPFLAET